MLMLDDPRGARRLAPKPDRSCGSFAVVDANSEPLEPSTAGVLNAEAVGRCGPTLLDHELLRAPESKATVFTATPKCQIQVRFGATARGTLQIEPDDLPGPGLGKY